MSAAVTVCAAAGRASDRHNASIPVTPATRLHVALLNLNRVISVLSLGRSAGLVLPSRLGVGQINQHRCKTKALALGPSSSAIHLLDVYRPFPVRNEGALEVNRPQHGWYDRKARWHF